MSLHSVTEAPTQAQDFPPEARKSNVPTIHVAKLQINNNTHNTIHYPAKDPTAEIIDSATKFIETVANSVSTACITFFWADKNVNVQNILDQIQEGISTRFQNILKSIFSPHRP